MNKAFVTLLIRSFRGGQATIAHYFYAISYYIIAVTGGGCFERTEISFIPFQGRIQRSVAITYPFEEQPDANTSIESKSKMDIVVFFIMLSLLFPLLFRQIAICFIRSYYTPRARRFLYGLSLWQLMLRNV